MRHGAGAVVSPLILPGDIPGLLRRCSPVIVAGPAGDRRSGVVAMMFDGPHVTMQPEGGEQPPWTAWIPGWSGASVVLDLTDATGRAHALRWWAERASHPARDLFAEPMLGSALGPRVITLFGGRRLQASSIREAGATMVPALAALNPDDRRTLPDGSRWVDAEALRLVCLHVAGRPTA